MIKHTEEEEPRAEEEQETARLLDEVARFFEAHLVADENVIRTLTLFATATWGMPHAYVTFPHLLFASLKPGLDGKNSGKTTGMNVTASLCINPRSAKGTYAGLRSKLVSAAVRGKMVLTLTRDQIEQVYGLDGMGKGGNPVLTMLLQEGYKNGSTDSISRQGAEVEYSLFHPLIMTANGTGLASDILERCVVVYMNKGTPRRYFSVRESAADATDLSAALGAAVREHLTAISEFRARGIHEKLDERLLEVWEPLFAVAFALGGQRWLNWCLEAFAAIGLDAQQRVMSPAQQVLRDSAALLEKVQVLLPSGQEFAEGVKLADELRRAHPKNRIYSTKTVLGVARLIADSMPASPRQVRIGQDRINGYYASDITAAWEAVKPEDMKDAMVPEEENPFEVTAVSDSDFDEVFDIRFPASGVTAVKPVRANSRKRKT